MFIIKAIKDLLKSKPMLFTTPGHSRAGNFCSEFENILFDNVYHADLSEVSGLDNLQHPTGAIRDSQKWAAEIYGSKESHYLVNGTSSGIMALMTATSGEGDKVAIARNAHKSVINALTLSGARPIWINTEWDRDWSLPANVSADKVKKSFDEHPEIKALWLTSPTYDGIITEIKPIADLCKERNILLIVDEAHAALWNFSNKLPTPAIHLGADASVQSLHKTAPALTQAAILHVSKESRINGDRLKQCINMYTTTSPSYIIMASIEAAIKYLISEKGKKRLNELIRDVKNFRIETYQKCNDLDFLRANDSFDIDPTKIFFGIKNVSGYTLSDLLEEAYNIEPEMENGRGVLALTGIGTSKCSLEKLAKALISCEKKAERSKRPSRFYEHYVSPDVVYTPRQAFYKEKTSVLFADSSGLVSAETIVKYPPGIPILIAGERIQQKHLQLLRGRKNIEIIKE